MFLGGDIEYQCTRFRVKFQIFNPFGARVRNRIYRKLLTPDLDSPILLHFFFLNRNTNIIC